MKHITLHTLLVLMLVLSGFLSLAQTTAIPDTNFEQQLVTLGYDTNGLNGNILNTDALAVTTLTLTGNTVTDLTGLEAFTNIITLRLGNSQVATVPTGTLTNLEELVLNNSLTLASIDVSNNLNLRIFDVRGPGSGSSGPIPLIDLSNNILLESIHIYAFYSLQNVTFPVTDTVEYVYLLMFAPINVDFSGYDNLETLTLSTNFNNTFPINVVLPSNPNVLQSASFQGGNLVNADFSSQLGLTSISMQSTNTQTLSLPVTTTLKRIRISSHRIDNVSFSNASELEDLQITNKTVAIPLVIDISQNPLLERLNVNSNYMTNIDVTQNTLLEDLNVSNNQLPTLNLTQNTILTDLNASMNLLPALDLTQNNILETLFLNNNLLPVLDVTQNTALRNVNISNNLFTTTGLDLTQNTNITSFNASFNQIASLDISQMAVVTNLILNNNLFSGTSILDQFFTIRQNDGGIRFGTFNVAFNNLSGQIPDYPSLFTIGTTAFTTWTQRFQFLFNNNNFEFGHFENLHPAFITALNTFRPAPFSSPVMQTYSYAPQKKVNTVDTINETAGNSVTLTTTVAGAQNHYVWFKDGVAIPGAPDSPTYIIDSVNPCDTGIYYSEIRSDLVPFENANPPGTGGRNLLLVRNDITLNVAGFSNVCPTLITPTSGATNVPLNQPITWTDNPNACTYSISIGTTAGGTQILNNFNVGDVNTYLLTANLPANTTIFIRVITNLQSGTAPACPEQSFTTGTTILNATPDCAILTLPLNNATNVAVNSNISWAAAARATGYRLSIGTTPGGTNVLNNQDLGNVLSYNPPADFLGNTIYYVTVIPYNGVGDATGCTEESFTTVVLQSVPPCTNLVSPVNNEIDVLINTSISWNTALTATGYFLSIGTTPGGTNILNNLDLGNTTVYNPPANLLNNTVYYVTVIPYNSTGSATGCNEESFRTRIAIPSCTMLTSPLNNAVNVPLTTNFTWSAAAGATNYRISIGTTPGGTDIVNDQIFGNVLTANLAGVLINGTTYYVTITPFNAAGNATGCIEESFTTITAAPDCTTITSPLDGEVNIAINTNISWAAATGATGYRLSIGTTPGGTNVLNNQDLGNVISYNPPANLLNDQIYFVTITPYNVAGNATGCTESSFTTQIAIPACTALTTPANGTTGIAINTSLSWTAAARAMGYRISIGTTAGGTNVLNNQDIGSVLTYNPPTNLLNNQTYFVTITPYNVAGNATGCTESFFTTQIAIPACTALTTPANGTTGIAINTSLSWTAAARATGYRISIGTTTGGTNVLNNQDIGSVLTYTPATNLLNNQTYFVTITSYNATGSGTGCTESSFTTQIAIPACTALTTPTNGATAVAINTNLSWAAAARATGYRLSIGTTPGGTSVLNNQDLGNVLTYNPPADLLNESTYYVTLIPYNAGGNATACVESTFTTIVAVPECTTLTTPAGSAANVAINTTLSWPVAARATGYRLSIGTSPGAVNILNNQDLGNVLTYSPPVNFLNGTTYYATVTAYNLAGNATGCSESTFTTILTIPACTTLNSPANGAVDVEITANLGWTRVAGAAGYILTMGTVPGGTDLLDNVDVGNSSRYNALADFEYGTTYYVTVTPYNVAGTSIACSETFFTTLTAVMVIPAYFTPNQDGYHDVWIIEDLNNEIARVTIFDRYGKLLVNTSSNIAWDGTFNGQPLPSSDYWYAITTTSGRVIKGHFSLVR